MFILFFFIILVQIQNIYCQSDSCLKLMPIDTIQGIMNPDSVMYDTCKCSNYVTCPDRYTKKWFALLLPYNAIKCEESPYDTILEFNWTNIDTSFQNLRNSFSNIENKSETL